MAAEKTITITVTEGTFKTEMKGFVNEAEGLAYLALATKAASSDLFRKFVEGRGESLEDFLRTVPCTCPACEAKAAMGPLQ